MINGQMTNASNKRVRPPPPPSFEPPPPSPRRSYEYRIYTINWCIAQPSDFVPLKNGFYSSRAQPDCHHPVYPGTSCVVVLRGVADLLCISLMRTHTYPVTRAIGVPHIACKNEFRRNLPKSSISQLECIISCTIHCCARIGRDRDLPQSCN